MSKRKYPISIRDVSPGSGAVRMAEKRQDGSSEGFHTGGAWLYRGKVWKPLDGRPYANADFHIETNEEDCLRALQGKSLFPKNWDIQESNGRRFLIRDKVLTFPNGGLQITLDQMYQIQDGLHIMNSMKWEVNDDLVIGKDKSGKLFIVDLSAANYTTGSHAYGADDSMYFNRLAKQAGFREIPELKTIATELSVETLFNPKFKKINDKRIPINYIYSSSKNIKIKDSISLNELIEDIPPKDRQLASKFFWIGTSQPIANNILKANDLRLRYLKKSR